MALVLAGPSLIILVGRAGAGQGATVLAWIMAVAAVLTGVANAIEDGFDQEGFGFLYLAGVVPFFYGMPVLALVLWLGDRRAFALIPALSFAGSLAFDQGGCILIGATWIVFGVLVLLGRAGAAEAAGAGGLKPSTARSSGEDQLVA